jgi:hypothetical protein
MTTYNGWSNYETWLVHLWLSNDQTVYDTLRAEALEAVTSDALYHAKNVIKNWVENELEQFLEGRAASMFVDLLRGALSEVNWYEIARHLRDEEEV